MPPTPEALAAARAVGLSCCGCDEGQHEDHCRAHEDIAAALDSFAARAASIAATEAIAKAKEIANEAMAKVRAIAEEWVAAARVQARASALREAADACEDASTMGDLYAARIRKLITRDAGTTPEGTP